MKRLLCSFLLGVFSIFASAQTVVTRSTAASASPQLQLPDSTVEVSDQIIFVNGDRLTGTIRELNEGLGLVVFQADSVGQVKVPFEGIRELRHGGMVLSVSSPNTTPPVRDVSLRDLTSPGKLSTLEPSTNQQYPCKWQALNRQGKPHLSRWRFSVNTGQGLTWIYGTQSQQTLGGKLELDLCEGSRLNETTVLLGGTHTRTSKIGSPAITGDVSDDTIIQKHMFSKPTGAGIYGAADAYLNNSLGLVLQRSVGLGLFSRVMCIGEGCMRKPDGKLEIDPDKSAITFQVLGDVRYINQRFYGISDPTNLFGTKLSQNAFYQKKSFDFSEDFWVIPAFNDRHGLQMFASGGPGLMISPWLCISLAEEERYLGDAPPGKRKNYLSSILKLTLQHNESSCK